MKLSLRTALGAVLLLVLPAYASAQELEPGAYWPIPRGLNILTVVNNFNWGDVAFDPAAPDRRSQRQGQHDGVFVHARVQARRTLGKLRRLPCQS